MSEEKKFMCRNGCGTEITWSDKVVSASGKKIPLEKATMQPHQCSKSSYSKEGGGGARTQDPGQANFHTVALEQRVQKLEEDVAYIRDKVNELF